MPDLNPFNYSDPVPPADLVNRLDEAKHLLELAEGGHNSRLLAPRRYGKTSLLLKVLDDAEKAGYRIVDVDFLGTTTPAEAARRIEEAYRARLTGPLAKLLNRVTRSWRPKAKAAPGGIGGELEYTKGTDVNQQLSDLLDLPQKILEKTGERTVVVFDEFQDFLRAGGGLDGLLRSKIQRHGDSASYMFCGSERAFLEEQFNTKGKPLFDQARPLYLEPLSDADLADYINERFEKTGRDPGEALDILLELVRGHPQRAMLIAHHLWERTPKGEAADAETFDEALAVVDRETQERFETTWQAYSETPNQRKVLKALALSSETLYNSRTLQAQSMSKSQAQSGEQGLLKAGEIHKVNGQPQLIDPLFERWLRQPSQQNRSG
jgi:AAA+ ATPase superfamily predicted ATPase